MNSHDYTEPKRYYSPYPRIGVGAFVRYQNKVVLVKRGQQPARGQWSLPGGLVELGETLDEAIHREIWEECSLRIEIDGLLDTFEFIEKDDTHRVKYHYIVLDFLATLKHGHVHAGSDVDEAQWFTREQVCQLDCSDMIKKLVERVFNHNSDNKEMMV